MIFPGKTREQVKTLVFMLAITVVVVSAVSGAYLLTADRIRMNQTLFFKRAVVSAAGLALPRSAAEVDRLYTERVRVTADTNRFEILDAGGGAVVGVVLRGNGVGLWGTIRAVVGFDADGATLTGIEFLEQSETPGLGARIEEAWFKHQFKGKRGPLDFVPEGTASKENEFDAITGATITSKGVRGLVNNCVGAMRRHNQTIDHRP